MTSLNSFQLTIHDPAGEERVFEIRPGTTTIGRQPGVTLVLEQQKVSRRHVQIECDGQDCFLTDLNSANGTHLDGKKLQPGAPYRLADGMAIGIGDYRLVFRQAVVELPEPQPPEAAYRTVALPAAEQAGEAAEIGEPPRQPPRPPAGDERIFPPGMESGRSRFLIRYLPEIYHTDFMARFLGIFEALLMPVEWTVDNFDLFLSPGAAPQAFLPWLSSWFGLAFDETWSEAQRRTLLAEASRLYAMRGTPWALSRMLEIYTGQKPAIDDAGKDLKPYTFTVRLQGKQHKANRKAIQQLIEANKPAHTAFVLEIEE